MSVLFYWNSFDGGETELYQILGTTEQNGTEAPKLADAARSFGLEAIYRTDLNVERLRHFLAKGYTIILNIQAWTDEKEPNWSDKWDDGHFVVLVGMDGTRGYFMDPSLSAGYGYIPLGELPERWHDYVNNEKVHNIGVLIKGRNPLKTMPAPLARIE